MHWWMRHGNFVERIPGPSLPVHANEELPRAKRRVEEEHFEVLVGGMIFTEIRMSAFLTMW